MSLQDSLKKVYFGPGGFMPVKSLHETILKEHPSAKLSDIKKWLSEQTIYQVSKETTSGNVAKYGHFFENVYLLNVVLY